MVTADIVHLYVAKYQYYNYLSEEYLKLFYMNPFLFFPRSVIILLNSVSVFQQGELIKMVYTFIKKYNALN